MYAVNEPTIIDTNTEPAAEADESSAGWQPITATICKKHRWQGGTTCVRCGASKPTKTATRTRTHVATARTSPLEEIIALTWGGIGAGIQRQPWFLKKPRTFLIDGQEIEGKPISVALGQSLQMEAAVAGRRIDRAFRKGSPLLYALVSTFLDKVTWVSDIGPLLIPPLIATAPPQVVQEMKPMLMSMLIPVLVEQAKIAQQQKELMDKLGMLNKEVLDQAEKIIDQLIGIEPDEPE